MIWYKILAYNNKKMFFLKFHIVIFQILEEKCVSRVKF